VLSLEPGEIKGTDTDVHFQERVPLDNTAPSTLNVQGTINLCIAQVFDPTLTSGGQVQFDIDAAAHNPAQNAEGVIRMLAYDCVRIGERTWTLRARCSTDPFGIRLSSWPVRVRVDLPNVGAHLNQG
jgi:hypothetical protein